jgi:hypothetical protein
MGPFDAGSLVVDLPKGGSLFALACCQQSD